MAKTIHYSDDKMNVPVAPVLAAVAMLLPLIVFALIGLDVALRGSDQDQSAILWMSRLDLSVPALWPAASVERYPESLPMAIDLKISPFYDWQADQRQLPAVHQF